MRRTRTPFRVENKDIRSPDYFKNVVSRPYSWDCRAVGVAGSGGNSSKSQLISRGAIHPSSLIPPWSFQPSHFITSLFKSTTPALLNIPFPSIVWVLQSSNRLVPSTLNLHHPSHSPVRQFLLKESINLAGHYLMGGFYK